MLSETGNRISKNELLPLTFPYPFWRIGIEINQRCNMHCRYCWNQKWNNTEIDFQQTRKILDSIVQSSQMWNSKQSLKCTFYAAEPLLSPHILEEAITNYPFYFSILTNGKLLEGDLAKFLYKPNVNISISLDGVKANHNKYRQDFDTVINNIIHFPSYEHINTAMTVNVDSLPYLYDSLVLMHSLPTAKFECQLNLYDNWTDELFNEYLDILEHFIQDYRNKWTLPGYELDNRFVNLNNANHYLKDRGGPLHQIDINNNVLIQKPNRSCILTPEKQYYLYGHIFATPDGFVNSQMKNEYLEFMSTGFNPYNYYSDNCNQCKYQSICAQDRTIGVYLQPKECYVLLETFRLKEKFWNV